MFRDMRHPERRLSGSEIAAVLDSRTSGVLAVHGDEGYPYAVPLSFARDGDKIFFHSAPEGYKLEALERDEKACFCVIDEDEVIARRFTTQYSSVIVFGRLRILTEGADKRHAMLCIVKKYSADHLEEARPLIEEALDKVCVVELSIEHTTGKRSPDPED